MNATLETVVVNEFGETKQQFVIDSRWQAGYAAYLAGFEEATSKIEFNAEYFKGNIK